MNTPNTIIKTASSSLPAGTRLAEFEITGVIGEGGFGIVYSAHDSSLERVVAVKEYLPSAFAQRAPDGGVQVKSEEHRKTFTAGLSSFINEARMLAKFSHPGLVEVFRFWESNGTAYMAMRYYRGVTLRETLRSSRQLITEQWLCETLDPILMALKELHNERCFHRDIAPDNILVLPNGKSVLMDFGAARRIISGMTQALTTVLKPGYAPIEQYYDDGSMPQGAWTDIYAIGGLLYHLMTGKVPVQAISRMMSDPLKPVADIAGRDFSERLCQVVMKCLAVLPENRYQSIDELREALGWVTLPVVSTVIHKPEVKPVALADFQNTVVMVVDASERHPQTGADPWAVHDAVPVKKPEPPEFDPDATVTSHVSRLAPVKVASIDAVRVAPAPRINLPVEEKVEEKRPASEQAGNKVSVVAKKVSPAVWMAGVAGIVVLLGGGLFLSGVFRSGTPAGNAAVLLSQPASASQPVAPVASDYPPVVAPPGASVVASGVTLPSEPASAPSLGASQAAVSAASAASAAALPKMGAVRVELVGGWGNVIIDGELKGVVPPVLVVKLAPGSHEVEIQNPSAALEKRSVTVVPGKTVVIRHIFSK